MEDGIETTRTAAVEGVRVRKTIDAGADETAVVTLEVELERDEPTTVRITEPALGAVARDEIELHTDHGAEHWRVGETATFEREFDAGESYEVVYRVTGVDEDRFDALDAEPMVDPVDAAIDDLVDRDDSDAVRELIAGERESLAAAPAAGGVELSLEADASDPASERAGEHAADTVDVDASSGPVDVDSGPVDVEAESGPVDVDADSGPVDGEADDPATEPAAASSGGPAEDTSPDEIPVDDPSEELSVGVPADDESADPADAPAETDLEAEDGAGGSATAPEEPAAVADSTPDDSAPADESPAADLEASLAATPSGGLARVLLKELREGHVDEATREALREELEPGRSQDVRIKHLQSQVAEFSAYVEMLDGFVDEHGTFDAVFGEMSSLDEEVESVRSELDGLADDVEDVDEATAAVEDLRDGQDALRDGREELVARVDRLEDELATVDDRLDEFDEFKERLSGAFQGVGDTQ